MDLKPLVDALRRTGYDQAHLVLEEEERDLARFASSQVNQYVHQQTTDLVARVLLPGRQGVALVQGEILPETVEAALHQAAELARQAPEDPDLPPLPENQPHRPLPGFDEATYHFGPREKGRVLEGLLKSLHQAGYQAFGLLETRVRTTTVVTTTGIEKAFRQTLARFKVIVQSPQGSTGFALGVGRSVHHLDLEALVEHARWRADQAARPRTLPPGRYTVILDPPAVGHLLLFLAFMGFGGRTIAQHWSFLRPGRRIMAERITIEDNALNPRTCGMPFDYEGVPKQRVVIVDHGIARNGVFDTYWARKAGTRSTGHALRPDNAYGPYPRNLILTAEGNGHLQDLLARQERALWISHLWYVNFFNPFRTQVTGTTRDGTLLVEDGQVKGGVQDMRFLVSLLEVLSSVVDATHTLTLTEKYSAHLLVPHLVVENFTFIQ